MPEIPINQFEATTPESAKGMGSKNRNELRTKSEERETKTGQEEMLAQSQAGSGWIPIYQSQLHLHITFGLQKKNSTRLNAECQKNVFKL